MQHKQSLDNRIENKITALQNTLTVHERSSTCNQVTVNTLNRHINLLKILRALNTAVSNKTYWIATSDAALKATAASSVISGISERLNKTDIDNQNKIHLTLSGIGTYCSEEKAKREANGNVMNPKISRLLNKIEFILEQTKILEPSTTKRTARANSYLSLSTLGNSSSFKTSTTTTTTQTNPLLNSSANTTTTTTTTTNSRPTSITTSTLLSTSTAMVADTRLNLEVAGVLEDLLADCNRLLTPTHLDIVAEQLESIDNKSSVNKLKYHAVELRKRIEARASDLSKISSPSKPVISDYNALEAVYKKITSHIKNENITAIFTKDETTDKSEWIKSLQWALEQIKNLPARDLTEQAGALVGHLNQHVLDPQIFIWFRQEKRETALIDNQLADRKAELQKYDCFLTVYNTLLAAVSDAGFWKGTSTGIYAASTDIGKLKKALIEESGIEVGYYYSVQTCQDIHKAITEFLRICAEQKQVRTRTGTFGADHKPNSKLEALFKFAEGLKSVFPAKFDMELNDVAIKSIKEKANCITTADINIDATSIKTGREQKKLEKENAKKEARKSSFFSGLLYGSKKQEQSTNSNDNASSALTDSQLVSRELHNQPPQPQPTQSNGNASSALTDSDSQAEEENIELHDQTATATTKSSSTPSSGHNSPLKRNSLHSSNPSTPIATTPRGEEKDDEEELLPLTRSRANSN